MIQNSISNRIEVVPIANWPLNANVNINDLPWHFWLPLRDPSVTAAKQTLLEYISAPKCLPNSFQVLHNGLGLFENKINHKYLVRLKFEDAVVSFHPLIEIEIGLAKLLNDSNSK